MKNQLFSLENNKIDSILNDDNISTKSKKKLEPIKKGSVILDNKSIKANTTSQNPTLLKSGFKDTLLRNDELDVKNSVNVVDLNANYDLKLKKVRINNFQ